MSDKGWSRTFDEPIPLPDGGELPTRRDAATYVTKLPKREHDAPEWSTAIEVLMLIAEHGGPTMMARIGMMRALHRHDEPAEEAGEEISDRTIVKLCRGARFGEDQARQKLYRPARAGADVFRFAAEAGNGCGPPAYPQWGQTQTCPIRWSQKEPSRGGSPIQIG
jgi:hypothetical protein